MDVDAEHASEDHRGELGGEGEQGCGAGLARVQADVLEPVSQAPAAEGMARASPRDLVG